MQTIKTLQLQEGMVTAVPVKSKHGQIIVDEGVVLTDTLIARISFYGIDYVQVEGTAEKPIPAGNVQAPTYSQKVKQSEEFKTFQIDYSVSTSDLKSTMEAIISRDGELNLDSLFSTTKPLFSKVTTSIELFDMLHNMRSVNDSVFAHAINVALISRTLGKWLKMSEADLDTLTLAGLLHDIGKNKIPPEILNKPGKYTDEEFELVKKHPVLGYQMLLPYNQIDPRIKNATLLHHERCDGSGYPHGFSGNDIDDFAQIIAIADVYDAMTAARTYRAPLCPFQVIAAFENEGLQKYNPKFILTFLEHIASTYQNNRVMLSDGRGANIIMLNKQVLSKPTVQVDDGSCIDLSKTPNLTIKSLL